MRVISCFTIAALALIGCKSAEESALEKAREQLTAATVFEFSVLKGHPIVDDSRDILYTSLEHHDIVAFDAKTGEILRKSNKLEWPEVDGAKQYTYSKTTPLFGGNRLLITPDGALIAAQRGGDYDIDIFDTKTLKKVTTIDVTKTNDNDAPLASTKLLAFHPSGTQILTVNKGEDDNIRYARLWDVKTGTLIKTLTHKSFFDKAAFSLDGQSLAVAHLGGKPAYIYKLETDKEIELQGVDVSSNPSGLVFTSGNNTLLGYISNGAIDYVEWNINTGERLQTLFSFDYSPGTLFSQSWLPSELGMIAHVRLDDNQDIIYIQRPQQERQALKLEGFSTFRSDHKIVNLLYGGSMNVGMSPDQRLVWIELMSGGFRFWNAETGDLVGSTTYAMRAINFSADGKFALIGGGPMRSSISIINVDALLLGEQVDRN